jgi:uncharacterized protein (TIGR02466 family)
MNIIPLFPSFLATLDTSNIINLENIKSYCIDTRDKNVGHIDPLANELIPLTTWITDQSNSIKHMQGIKDSVTPKLENCWINYSDSDSLRASHINFPHAHINYWISFVYYVQYKTDAGQLTLMSPFRDIESTIPRKFIDSPNIHNSGNWAVLPHPGLAVAFPSWLVHYVEPNHSNTTRISIAYNFSLPHQLHDIVD